MRLNKYLSSAGVCSRREADRLIEAGRVKVNGKVAGMGEQAEDTDKVEVDGKEVRPVEENIILAVNKPEGVVCTTDKRWGDRTLEEMVDYPTRVFGIGRLDKNSCGLILMTNQGDILNRIMKAGNFHEKEYDVTVDRDIDERFIKKMSGGVYLEELDRTTRPCEVVKTGKRSFRIILTQGLNRQIRRMCVACGCRVVKLRRTRIMNITVDGIREGSYRPLTKAETDELMRLIAASSNNTEHKYMKNASDALAKGEKR